MDKRETQTGSLGRLEWEFSAIYAWKLMRPLGEVMESSTLSVNDDSMKFKFQITYKYIKLKRQYDILLDLLLDENENDEMPALCYDFWINSLQGKRVELRAEIKDITEDQQIAAALTDSSNNLLFNILSHLNEGQSVSICCEVKQKPQDSIRNEADMCILQVGRKEFQISKAILTAQSDVFQRLLSNEGQNGIVKMPNINVNIFEAMVSFLNDGSVENLDNIAYDLFMVANEYKIVGLKNLCVTSMSKSVTKDNLFDRLVLAFEYKNDSLKTHILDFISKGNNGAFKTMVASDQWFEFAVHNKELAKEILDVVFKKLNFNH